MDWFKNLLNGYYNVTPPETWEGERKPHWSDDMDSTKVGSYWNYVPSETWSGERKPHFSDDLVPLTDKIGNYASNIKESTLFDLLNKKEYGTLDIPFDVSRNMKP